MRKVKHSDGGMSEVGFVRTAARMVPEGVLFHEGMVFNSESKCFGVSDGDVVDKSVLYLARTGA